MCLRRKRRGDTGVKNLLGCQDFSPHISYYQPRRRSRRLLVKRRIKINSHSCSLVILFRSLVCFQDYPKSATKETTLLDGPLTKHPGFCRIGSGGIKKINTRARRKSPIEARRSKLLIIVNMQEHWQGILHTSGSFTSSTTVSSCSYVEAFS